MSRTSTSQDAQAMDLTRATVSSQAAQPAVKISIFLLVFTPNLLSCHVLGCSCRRAQVQQPVVECCSRLKLSAALQRPRKRGSESRGRICRPVPLLNQPSQPETDQIGTNGGNQGP